MKNKNRWNERMKRTCTKDMWSIDVRGIPPGKLFAALFNEAKDNGNPRTHRDFGETMSPREADAVLTQAQEGFVGYYARRVISIQFFKDSINPLSYDRYNGKMKAAGIVSRLKEDLKRENEEKT